MLVMVLLDLLLLGWLLSQAGAASYYVTPSLPNPDCSQPCHTVDYYANRSQELFNDKVNVSLLFLEGVHTLSFDLFVIGIENVVLTGVHNNSEGQILLYSNGLQFVFIEVLSLHIEFMEIHNNTILIAVQTLLLSSTVFNELYSPIVSNNTLIVECKEVIFRQSSFEITNQPPSILSGDNLHYQAAANSCNIEISFTDCQLLESSSTAFSVIRENVVLEYPMQRQSNVTVRLVNTTVAKSQSKGILLDVKSGNLILEILNSTINDNQRGGASINAGGHISNIHIESSTFERNRNIFSPPSFVALLVVCAEHSFDSSHLVIKNLIVRDNANYHQQHPIISIAQCGETKFVGCNIIENNWGTAVQIFHSDLFVFGNLFFSNNSAEHGGAIALFSSTLNLHRDTNVTFDSNSAFDTGGAIYVHLLHSSRCFYQLPELVSEDTALNINVVFTNNSAHNGGEAIYGAGLLDNCSVSQSNSSITSNHVHAKIFSFDGYSNSSQVSSDPVRVCLCNEFTMEPNCSVYHKHRQVFPSENIFLPLVLVGKDYGPTSGLVHVSLLRHGNDAIESNFIELFHRHLDPECSRLKLSLAFQPPCTEKLTFTASDPHASLLGIGEHMNEDQQKFVHNSQQVLSLPVYLDVSIQHCPLGFTLSDGPQYSCICDPLFDQIGVLDCIISNQTIKRQGDVWVGGDSSSKTLYGREGCEYCKPGEVSVDIEFPNSQCDFNRGGIMCGGCAENFSLPLGSYRCKKCDTDASVLLIIPILLLLIFVVCCIRVLEINVSKGTLNGLIFYANIMHTYQNVLAPDQEISGEIARSIIAWLNVDYGFVTCFIREFDSYRGMWLEFSTDVFVFLIIAGFMWIAARYSTLITRVLGNNPIAVIATLFFISNGSLIDSIAHSLSFRLLPICVNQSCYSSVRWYIDSNIPYFGLEHSFLFIAAVLALSCLWLPYSLILLCAPYWRKKEHWCCSRCIAQLKPYFDACFAPLKAKYHYWFGLLLTLRGLIGFVFVVVPTYELNLIILILVASFLTAFPAQYADWRITALEKSFFINLVLLSSTVLFVISYTGERYNVIIGALVTTSIYIVLLQFIGIVCYYGYWSLRKIKCKRGKSEESTNQATTEPTSESAITSESTSEPTTTEFELHEVVNTVSTPVGVSLPLVLDYTRYRETLLEST